MDLASASVTARAPSRAAQYVRMSTEHQQYSPENQLDIIRQYPAAHNMEIVREYSDHGRSGLNIAGREGLNRLMAEVEAKRTNFTSLLVYDVSCWGRFQDVDESAYYEYVLKRSGIRIHYCTEQFENDGSMSSSVLKTLKRSMAAEYSRELSVKVFSGQCRLIELGFRQGGAIEVTRGRETECSHMKSSLPPLHNWQNCQSANEHLSLLPVAMIVAPWQLLHERRLRIHESLLGVPPRRLREIAMISKPPRRSRVFIVDEELLFASCLRLFLREDGHDARSFADPLEALFASHFAPPDILVSDVALKLIAGIHLATWIREDVPACHVLLFSKGVETNSLLASASSAGNEISLVPAPVHLLALMERIQSLIQDVHPPRTPHGTATDSTNYKSGS